MSELFMVYVIPKSHTSGYATKSSRREALICSVCVCVCVCVVQRGAENRLLMRGAIVTATKSKQDLRLQSAT